VRFRLRKYQQAAVEAVVAGLGAGGRGQVYAACGSGKTVTALACADRLVPGPGVVVVLVPTLALVAQTIGFWREHARLDTVLAVCSDDTVADDDATLADIPAEATTGPDTIRAWWSRPGRKLVVGTYLSARRIAEALHDTGDTIDLLIMDEAHHLAGYPDQVTVRVLDDRHLPALRRLAMTATPRVDTGRAETTGVLSMSDTAVFGPVLHEYPWAQAISDGHLDDYRLVVMGVTAAELRDLLTDPDHEYTDAIGAPGLRVLAAQAIAAKAAHQFGLRRLLVFTPRVDSAAEFARTAARTVARLPAGQRPDEPMEALHVHGGMDHAQRARILDRLRHPAGWTMVANCRCLSEGVDVPAIDAVLFTHAKSSQVDIVQAVGRAMRRSPGGTGVATVIVPIVVPDSIEEIGDLDPGEFRVLWQVVRALRAHDETWGIELGPTVHGRTRDEPLLPSRLTVVLPGGTSQDVLEGLTAQVVKSVQSPWWEGYAQACAYRDQHGHLDVPSGHITADGHRLGGWIANARMHRRKGWLSDRRIAALDDIGMNWNPRRNQWQELLDHLRAFHAEHGHLLVPQAYRTRDGFALGSRVNRLRVRRIAVPGQFHRDLDALGMVWDTRALRWQEFFGHCAAYVAQHGHLQVPTAHVAGDGYPLGVRMQHFRRKVARGRCSPEELEAMGELGFDVQPTRWGAFLKACDRYVAEHGSLASVQRGYTDPSGYPLGKAIADWRALAAGSRPGKALEPDRRAELDARGMVWRVAPVRDVHADEVRQLRSAQGPELGALILRLIDGEAVTQSSIAEALGTHRSYLNTKIRQFRDDGTWPTRNRDTGVTTT
jgi:superfamily II DNA or RNA helicase